MSPAALDNVALSRYTTTHPSCLCPAYSVQVSEPERQARDVNPPGRQAAGQVGHAVHELDVQMGAGRIAGITDFSDLLPRTDNIASPHANTAAAHVSQKKVLTLFQSDRNVVAYQLPQFLCRAGSVRRSPRRRLEVGIVPRTGYNRPRRGREYGSPK